MHRIFLALCLSVASIPAAGAVEDIVGAYKSGDYARAWSGAIPAAAGGDANAQHLIGTMLYNGRGTAQDRCMATLWFDKAARQGHAEAQYRMGNAYAWGYGVYRRDALAYQWMMRAAHAGHREAGNWLAAVAARLPPEDHLSLKEVLARARYETAAEGDFYPLP